MSSTNYLEGQLLAAALAKGTYTGGNVYVALYSVAPTDSTSGTELSGYGYARPLATFTVSGTTANNSASSSFGANGGTWSTAVAVGLVSDSTGGNILFYKDLVPNQTLRSGDSLVFGANSISISLD